MDYKLYLIGKTGRIASRIDLDFVDDESALAVIPDPIEGLSMELWRRATRVKSFPAGAPRLDGARTPDSGEHLPQSADHPSQRVSEIHAQTRPSPSS